VCLREKGRDGVETGKTSWILVRIVSAERLEGRTKMLLRESVDIFAEGFE